MANVKISNLTAATTPLAGTEVLPVVQSGTTVKASIANVQTATYSGGTANGVAYLNGSKVLTTGSALTFDGTNLTATNGATIQGLTVGRGGAGGAANTAYGASAIPIAPNSGVVAIGSNAGKLFNTASDTGQSTFVGYFAGAQVSTGTDSTFVGGSAGTNTTTGAKNTAVGSQALQLTTTASYNTAVGYQAGYTNVTGIANTFTGYQAGYTSNASSVNGYNTATGYQAGKGLTTGNNNSFFGLFSGELITTGGKNSILGAYNGNNGGLDIRTASNYIVLSDGDGEPRLWFTNAGALLSPTVYSLTTGSAANVFVGSNGHIHRSTSSLKYKRDVQDATHGLAVVLTLRPVTYKGKAASDGETVFGGLIAEEVHAAGLTEFVQYADDGSPDALAYGNMVSLCIKAIQEQQAIITLQAADIEALKAKVGL